MTVNSNRSFYFVDEDSCGFDSGDDFLVYIDCDRQLCGYDSDERHDAAQQAFRDEYGAEHSFQGGVFELVAVPDDVAESQPCPDGLVVLVGELLHLPED